MQSTTKITTIDIDEWKKVFDSCNTSNYFFSPKWLTFQADLFNLENLFFKVTSKDTELYIPFQMDNYNLFSNFIAYGGFMTNDYEIIDSELLFSTIRFVENKFSRKLKRLKTYPLVSIKSDTDQHYQSTAILKLHADFETQSKMINKKNRYEIKKSLGHKIQVGQLSASESNDFYSLYLFTMKRVNSEYRSPQRLINYCCSTSDCIVLGAYHANELVAGSIFAYCNNGIYHWFNVSSEMGRKTGANYAIIDSIIKRGIASSFSFINLGSSHSQSILVPKLRWGSQITKYISLEN